MIKNRKFTVIEVLVAIALTMVIGWLVSLAFNNTSQACRGVTSTLDYQAKGNAILSMIATDIENMCLYTGATITNGGHIIEFKSVIPRQRTRYSTNASLQYQSGDYDYNIVGIKWIFDNNEGAKNLYRMVTAPNVAGISNSPADHAWDDYPSQVTTHDIRNFTIKAVGTATAGFDNGITNISPEGTSCPGYTVSFYLTNAPLDVKSPMDLTNATADEKDKSSKYIWQYFSRTIATR